MRTSRPCRARGFGRDVAAMGAGQAAGDGQADAGAAGGGSVDEAVGIAEDASHGSPRPGWPRWHMARPEGGRARQSGIGCFVPEVEVESSPIMGRIAATERRGTVGSHS